MKTKQKNNSLLSIAEASEMTPARIGAAFHERYVLRTKAFAEQGKLAYALSIKKLAKGKSVQGILLEKGSPRGSVGNARKAAAIIKELVITDLISEEVFDTSVTWRTVRFANKVLGLDKGSTQVIPPETVAEIINSAKTPADAANTLECWDEHKCSPEEQTAKLKEQKAAEQAAEVEAQKRADEIKADDKEFDQDESSEETPDESSEETPDESSEETPDESSEETPAPASSTPEPVTSTIEPEPEGVTLENILERVMEIRVDSTELNADDTSTLLDEVNDLVTDLIGAIETAAVADAA